MSNLQARGKGWIGQWFVLLFAVAGWLLPLGAQVRKNPTISSFVRPAATDEISRVLGAGGDWPVLGGVEFFGSASFWLESGSGNTVVNTPSVGLSAGPRGAVFLTHAGKSYRLTLHDDLACRLARFVARGGRIAYTIPPDQTSSALARLEQMGVVEGAVAKEFFDTPIEDILDFADLDAETEALPSSLEREILSSVSTSLGRDRRITGKRGTYINADYQVTYKVYLTNGRVETEGVPLRYHWDYGEDGLPVLVEVEALAQDWPEGASLTDFSRPDAEPSQLDAISLFQNAAIFRQVKRSNPRSFERFKTAVCQ